VSEVHASDCALHNEPAFPAGPCNCYLSGNGTPKPEPLPAIEGRSQAFKDFLIWKDAIASGEHEVKK